MRAPTWFAHLVLIYFKRLYLNRPAPELCPRRPACPELLECGCQRRQGHAVSKLAVLGNISRDLAIYPDGRQFELLGGAALHVARAAFRAGLAAAPVSVIGADLGWIRGDPRLAGLDLTSVKVVPGPSCAFTLTYTGAGKLAGIDCSFGAAESLTSHCLTAIGRHGQYHVCCRRPLGVRAVLGRLARAGLMFSTDFHLASARETDQRRRSVPAACQGRLRQRRRVHHPRRPDRPGLPGRGCHLRRASARSPCSGMAPPPSPSGRRHTSAAEVTGAGDTLAGTFLASVARGLSDGDALRAAVTAAAQSIRGPGLAITGH